MTAGNWMLFAGLLLFVVGLSIASPLITAGGVLVLLMFAWSTR